MDHAFVPPFCPRSSCPFHTSPAGWRYKRIGFYTRRCEPRCIQRYLCIHCRRSFSTQTFSTTYWLRHPERLAPVFHRLLACSGFRQIARELKAAPTSLLRLASRLGRHCLLFQRLHQPEEPKEPVVLDGFESFEWSQYFPCHFHLLVGKDSHFFYGFTDSPLRRKGRMTAEQKDRRVELEQELGRPDPKSIENEVVQLLQITLPPGRVRLHSDDHPAYPRAFRQVKTLTVEHDVTPGILRRTTSNPLFPVNLLDLLIRHNSANHKRETIAFS
ncbi:MAG TPA: hypothetical protein VEY91_09845, partial [Candidatus Limnocylindria bacterium]|nr:hypothetical protein [Candidatus Limnocylindria bacterium]